MTTNMKVQSVSPAELSRQLSESRSDIQLIDVRTPVEFENEHIEGSLNIPLDELDGRTGELLQDHRLVMICRTGNRAGKAATKLAPLGHSVAVLTGGIVDWKSVALPLATGKQRLPLERQVQLTIGLILLSSVTAGFLIDPLFFIVPGFIGAGLTFAGATGFCGLAMLLAKAPWNKVDSGAGEKNKTSCCS